MFIIIFYLMSEYNNSIVYSGGAIELIIRAYTSICMYIVSAKYRLEKLFLYLTNGSTRHIIKIILVTHLNTRAQCIVGVKIYGVSYREHSICHI